jgi:fatty acid CoA ligase FadD22
MTIVARLTSHPSDATAVELGGRAVSYGEFRADIDRAAAYLQEQGVGPGTALGIHFGLFRDGDDYACWVAHLAAIQLGATHASVYDRRSLAHLLAGAKIDAVVGSMPDGFADDIRVIPLDLKSLPARESNADDEAKAVRLNLTSGTTGTPKVVRWDSAMIEGRIDQVSDLELIGSDTCLDSFLSPRTTGGFRYPIATWWAGGRVLLSGGGSFGEPGRAARSTLAICSPFQLQRLRANKLRWPNREKRTIVVLGGRVAPRVRDWALSDLADQVIISYGSTEAGTIAHGDARLTERHPGAVGWIRKDVEVRITGPGGVVLETGKVGKVRLRTKLMARADGSERPDDEWFEPGDFGVIFDDGLLAIGGRMTDVLNIGGLKISASDLETKLMALDSVEDVTAGVVPMPNGDTLWIAAVPSAGQTPNNIVPHVRRMLTQGVPFRVVLVSSIPRNAMGKVDRPRLVSQVRNQLRKARQRMRVNA